MFADFPKPLGEVLARVQESYWCQGTCPREARDQRSVLSFTRAEWGLGVGVGGGIHQSFMMQSSELDEWGKE